MRDHPVLREAAAHGVRLGLNRMGAFMQALGSPHLARPTLHVAGTNGKGSVVRTVASLLEAHGLRTGELSSPHLQEVNERIRLRGEPIGDADLDRLLNELSERRRAWAAELGEDAELAGALTYFELTTAAGFLYLAEREVDVMVVEVGLGGRLDATNLVRPEAAAIVSIGIDHTEELGPDIPSIAAEKAGIIKPSLPTVLGPLEGAAMRVIRAIAADRGAPILAPGEGYQVGADREGRLWYRFEGIELDGVELALKGHHQLDNAGVALTLAALFLRPRGGLRPEAARLGLAHVRHAGRLEWLLPDLLVDAAHNVAGASALAAALRDLPRDCPRTLLLGASADKDCRAIAVALEGLVDRVITTHCAHPRALPAGSLAARLVGLAVPVLPAGPVEEALPLARRPGELVIAAGSIFLVGAVRDLVRGEREQAPGA